MRFRRSVLVLLMFLCAGCDADEGVFTAPTALVYQNGYQYAPAVYRDGDELHVFYCGESSRGSGQDAVFAGAYDEATGTWTLGRVVVPPGDSGWDAGGACDPSVVKGAFMLDGASYAYAMYYRGHAAKDADDATRPVSSVGVALSNDLETWVKGSAPVVEARQYALDGVITGFTAVAAEGAVDLFVRLTSSEGNGLFVLGSEDGVTFDDPGVVTTKGAPFGAHFDIAATDDAYYAAVPNLHRPGETASYGFGIFALDRDDLFDEEAAWHLLAEVDTERTGSYSNHTPTLVRGGGPLTVDPELDVYFAEGGANPASWDLARVRVDLTATEAPLTRYARETTGERWDSTGHVPGDYQSMDVLGTLYTHPTPGTHPIYACIAGENHFISRKRSCEGHPQLGLLGWAFTNTEAVPDGITTTAVYRCKDDGDHFLSSDADCEGSTPEGVGPYFHVVAAGE